MQAREAPALIGDRILLGGTRKAARDHQGTIIALSLEYSLGRGYRKRKAT